MQMMTQLKQAFKNTAVLFILVLSALAMNIETVFAKPTPPKFTIWADPTPSALKPFAGDAEALADLAGNTLFFYPQAKQKISLPYPDGVKTYNSVQYVTGAIVVSASPAQVKAVLNSFTDYKTLFPNLTKADVLASEKQSGTDVGRSIVNYHVLVKIPFPLLSFDEDVLLQHEQTANSISTLILKSPIQYGSGKFEWFALNNGKTLVTLTQWGDLDKPKGFLLRTIFRALPEIKWGIPSGVEGFVLESLRNRFNPDAVQKALPQNQIVPALSLTASQQASVQNLLQAGGVVQFCHRPVWLNTAKRAEKLWFVSSIYAMPASLDKTKEAFATPQYFPKIYRQVRKVTSTVQPDGSLQTDVKVGIGLGVLSIPMHLNLNYKTETNGDVRFSSTGGDVEFIEGRLQFNAINAQKTLVTLTSSGKLGEKPPVLLRLGKHLPYSDFLPTVGSAPVMFEKVKAWVTKK